MLVNFKTCLIKKTHNHSDLGCLYKAGGLTLFHKKDSRLFRLFNENKCAIFFISQR